MSPEPSRRERRALETRMMQLGVSSSSDYVKLLESPEGIDELRYLISLVTVGKTEFFRDETQLTAFSKRVLPQLISVAKGEGRQVRVWSAGCATGEEGYTLAMLADELGADSHAVSILGTDVNVSSIAIASRGIYALKRLGGLSNDRRARFFLQVGNEFVANDLLRRCVAFRVHNLVDRDWSFISPGGFDVIFCRNVLMYFDNAVVASILDRFYEALRPGGLLFLGYSEAFLRMGTRFNRVEIEGVFIFQRPHATE